MKSTLINLKKIFKYIFTKIVRFILFAIGFITDLFIKFISKNYFENLFREHWSSNKKYTNIEKFFLESFYYVSDFSKRKLINTAISKESAVKWAQYYRSKTFPDEDFSQKNSYKYTEEYINENKLSSKVIHQICCGSGREIEYFSKLNCILKFQASEIYKEIIIDIKEAYPNSNFELFVIDLTKKSDIKKCLEESDLILAFGGLQYLLPKDIINFFKAIKTYNCDLIISQPIHAKLNSLTLTKSIPRGNLSWSHPYNYLAKKNKLKILKYSTAFFPQQPWARTVYAHYSCK